MFSGVIKYLWNPDEESESLDSTNTSGTENSIETKVVVGQVTSIHSGYGMIDNEIYFSLDCSKGQRAPQLHDTVEVEATRQQASGGWCAVHLRIVEPDAPESDHDQTWESSNIDAKLYTKDGHGPACDGQEQFLVGMVTRTGKDGGVVNESYNFLFSDCCQGYVPHKGDWVNVKLAADFTNAESVRPVREQSFEGRVNTVLTGFGYINSDIYFTFSVCEEGYTPRRGERVCGKAIESTRGRSTWRALTVIPIQGNLADKFISPEVLRSPTQLKSLKDLYADKESISITDPIDFGKVQVGNTKMFSIWIRNSGASAQTLENVQVRSATDSQFHLTADVLSRSLNVGLKLEPGASTKVLFYCTAKYLGSESQLLVVNFSGFQVGRQVSVSVTDPQQYTLASGNNPYKKRTGYTRYRASQESGVTAEGWLVPGQRPQSCQPNIQLPNRLPQFPVPSDLRKCFLDREDLVCLVPALGEELTTENYTRRFQTLLHLEEIQDEIDIRDFDLERVCLRPCGEFLALTVPGLAEGRPSVLIGDRVILSVPIMPENSPEYEGYVHEVMRDEVLLKFEQNFHSGYHGEDYNVRFTFNRTTLRRCHQAVEFAPRLGEQVLFPDHLIPKPPQNKPTKAFTKEPHSPMAKQSSANIGMKKCPLGRKQKTDTETIKLFNAKLNTRQKAAVVRILRGQSRPTPYVLFGPPGTGKTVTLVEAILQIFTVLPGSRIIACAPSNSAADLLCERLHESGRVGEGDMVRLNAFQRTQESIPECIRRYVCTGSSLELVSRYRILVCTCVSAGMMFSLGLKPGHFTHAVVDEAGQATEAECMIPVGLVAGTDGQVVLAGDPMQLGPVLQSREAKDYGLGMSLLERLIHRKMYTRNEQKFYDHGSYDPLLVTKLVENYRSHPVLINLPSKLFYHNELVVSAEKQMIDCLCDWEQLPNKNSCPLIFHGMRGEDLREGNSPSWFNPVEALQVMKYLQAVVSNSVHTVSFDDVGIITPYRKQVEKIRLLIDKLGMEKVKVGSVEEFQGQERLVMIISTVRSNERHVGLDLRHNLGFLSNEKRFNVAVTRAQALLIVIGNPHVLYQDPMWKALLHYSVKQNAYVGCDLPELGEEDTESETEEEVKCQEEVSESCDPVTPVAPPSELERKIIKQMEYYFGDMNLIRDSFLQEHMQKNKEGWVEISVILTFNKMKALTTDTEEACAALDKSVTGLIQVNPARSCVRRSGQSPLITEFEPWKEKIQPRTVVVEGLKIGDARVMENFQNFLEREYGEVEHIERGIPKVKRGKYPAHAQLVVFKQASTLERLPVSGQLVFFGLPCWMLPPHHLAVDECIDYFYKRQVQKLDRYLVKPVGRHWYSNKRAETENSHGQPKPTKSSSDKPGTHLRNSEKNGRIERNGVHLDNILQNTEIKQEIVRTDTEGNDPLLGDDEESTCSVESGQSTVTLSGENSEASVSSQRDVTSHDDSYKTGIMASAGSYVGVSSRNVRSLSDENYGTLGSNLERDIDSAAVPQKVTSKTRINQFMKYMEKDGIKYVRGKKPQGTTQVSVQSTEQVSEVTNFNATPENCSPFSERRSGHSIQDNLSLEVSHYLESSVQMGSGHSFQDNLPPKGGHYLESSVQNEENLEDTEDNGFRTDRSSDSSADKSSTQDNLFDLETRDLLQKPSKQGVLYANGEPVKQDGLAEVCHSPTDIFSGRQLNDTKESSPSKNRAHLPGIGRGAAMRMISEHIGSHDNQFTAKPSQTEQVSINTTEGKLKVLHRTFTPENSDQVQKHRDTSGTQQGEISGECRKESELSSHARNVIDDRVPVMLTTLSKETRDLADQYELIADESDSQLPPGHSEPRAGHCIIDSHQNGVHTDYCDSLTVINDSFLQDSEESYKLPLKSPAQYNVNIITSDSDTATFVDNYPSLPSYYCAELAQSDSDVIVEEEEEEEVLDHMTRRHVTSLTDGKLRIDVLSAKSDTKDEGLHSHADITDEKEENWT